MERKVQETGWVGIEVQETSRAGIEVQETRCRN